MELGKGLEVIADRVKVPGPLGMKPQMISIERYNKIIDMYNSAVGPDNSLQNRLNTYKAISFPDPVTSTIGRAWIYGATIAENYQLQG